MAYQDVAIYSGVTSFAHSTGFTAYTCPASTVARVRFLPPTAVAYDAGTDSLFGQSQSTSMYALVTDTDAFTNLKAGSVTILGVANRTGSDSRAGAILRFVYADKGYMNALAGDSATASVITDIVADSDGRVTLLEVGDAFSATVPTGGWIETGYPPIEVHLTAGETVAFSGVGTSTVYASYYFEVTEESV